MTSVFHKRGYGGHKAADTPTHIYRCKKCATLYEYDVEVCAISSISVFSPENYTARQILHLDFVIFLCFLLVAGASGKPPSQGIQQVPVGDSQFKLKVPIVGKYVPHCSNH